MMGYTKKVIIIGLIFIALLLFPLTGAYWTSVAIFGLIWSITALSLNIVMGYTGQISIGHAALFGIGAYGSAITSIWFLPIWLSIPVGGLLAGVFSLLIGYPSTRTRGIYFSIITMSFSLIMVEVFINLEFLTGGLQGLSNIPTLGLSNTTAYFLLVLITLLVVYVTKNLVDSRHGDAMKAVRENENLAKSLGISVENTKLLSFIISGFIAGVAGGLYAHYVSFLSPNNFTVMISFNILVFVILGGTGTLWGPIIGALFLSFLPEFLQIEPSYKNVFYGILLGLTIILMPKGIASIGNAIGSKLQSRLNLPNKS